MKPEKKALLVWSVCLFLVWVERTLADTTNLPPVADTYLQNTLPDANFGGSPVILVGVSASLTPKANHALFQFSLASIPTNATITGATRSEDSVSGSRPAVNYDLYRLLQNWDEAEATWNLRVAPSTTWTSPGGQAGTDYIATPSTTAPIDVPPATNNFRSATMVADLQLWLSNPGTNFGWIVIAVGEQAGSGKQLGSREDIINSPVLEVQFTVPPPPVETPTNTLFDVARAGSSLRFSFNVESNQTYAIESRNSLTTGSWNELTNIPALPTNATLHFTNLIAPGEGYFRARRP
jgi:hypothetical protein